MKIDLMRYTSAIPLAKRLFADTVRTDTHDLTNALCIAGGGIPIIVCNRFLAAIKGETDGTLKQKESLIKFYGYSEILGEDELKELINAKKD